MSAKAKRLFSAAVSIAAAALLMLGGCADGTSPRGKVDDFVTRDDTALTVCSPNGDTAFTLTVKDGRLHYAVSRGEREHLRPSPLGFTVDGVAYGEADSLADLGDVTGGIRTDVRRLNGRKAVADDPCVQATIPVGDDGTFALEVRVFDNGAAFRYHLEDDGSHALQSEQTAFRLPVGSTVWAGESHQYHESTQQYWNPAKYTVLTLGVPVTVPLKDGGFTTVLEGDLVDYPGIQLAWKDAYYYESTFNYGGRYTLSGRVCTPWRIIAVADDLNELVNNTIVYQVCDEADERFDTDWVTPGRAAWSWITGRTTDRVTPALMQEYTDYAAKLGFEYNIIDEGWVNWPHYEDTLKELAAQGDDYGVGQILWTGVTAGASFGGGIRNADEAYAYLDLLDELGMTGGKIDFFTTENQIEKGVNLYRDILDYAADKGLVINFHGCNKPTGLDVTYPNELNREAILGLESTHIQNRKTLAQMFTTQPFVRNLAGHADFTPAVDTAFHMAQLVLTDAPMQAIGSNPADILQSDALEMIKSVPTVWQETVVLEPSALGKAAVIARKGADGSWYVGGINHTAPTDTVTLDLSAFLGEGTYRCELWTDETGGLTMTEQTVTASDTLVVPFDKLTGFIVRFDRVTLSQYGGEIDPDNPVTVTVHDPDTTVKYTLDGQEPGLFAKTLSSGDTLTLTDSCVLTLKITSGPDKGLTRSYRFNQIKKD